MNPALPRAGCVAAGNLTTPPGLGFLGCAVGVLTAASEPRVSGESGQTDQAGLVNALPTPLGERAAPPPQLAPGGRSCTWVVGPQGGVGPPS